MMSRSLSFVLATLIGAVAMAVEQINVNYQYDGNHRADFSRVRGGRAIWQTNLFGRGTAEDIATATHAALTRLIRELMNDDYFLIELQ